MTIGLRIVMAGRRPGAVSRPCRRLPLRWLWCCGSRDPKAAEDRNRRRACAGESTPAEGQDIQSHNSYYVCIR